MGVWCVHGVSTTSSVWLAASRVALTAKNCDAFAGTWKVLSRKPREWTATQQYEGGYGFVNSTKIKEK